MRKIIKRLLAAALVCGMSGCGGVTEQTDTEQTVSETVQTESAETTSEIISETAADSELFVETLAEGEKRDWSVEDILKNDLEIDGIPVSIPCTLNELLEALGEDYSVDEDEIKDEFKGESTTKSKYFNGEFLPIQLYYAGEKTYGFLRTIADPNNINLDTINVIGFFGGIHNGIVNLTNLSAGDSLEKCLKIYDKPNKVKSGEKFTSLIYEDDGCFIQIDVKNNNKDTIDSISMVGLKTEDIDE